MKTRLCANCGERFAANLDRCPGCDTHAHRQTEGAKVSQSTCIAHGCPLPGTVSDDLRGAGPWMCSAHKRAQPSDWPAVTERIRSAGWLWSAVNTLRQEGPSEFLVERISAACKARPGFESLAYVDGPAPEGDGGYARWSYRFQLGYFAWCDTGRCDSRPRQIGPQGWPQVPAVGGNVSGLLPSSVAA